MDSRVGELDLSVRTPSGRADATLEAARHFTCRVLERCDALLEQRAPGRLVFMRELDMEWRVWDHALDVSDEVDAVAAEVASALDDEARAQPASPDGAGNMAVFEDAAHYRAEYLHAVSRRRAEGCWFFAPLFEEGPPPGFIAVPGHRALAEAVLTRLAAKGVLAVVLSALPVAAVAALSESLAVGGVDAGAQDEGPTGSPMRRTLSAFIHSHSRSSNSDAQPSPAGMIAPRDGDIGPPDASPALPVEIAQRFDTPFGGLFYLLSPALELSLGEWLWTACISEAAVFTRIAEAFLGLDADADPAPRLFGSAETVSPLAAVSAEQHAEVARDLLGAMGVALTRGRPPDLPVPHLRIVPTRSGRVLVATVPGSAFGLFAWPADSPHALREGVAAFLAAWPPAAPRPSADPALASLDRTGRLTTAASEDPRPWILDQDGDPCATALLTQAAGSLAFLFASRVGAADVTSPAQIVERHLAVPARVIVTDEELEIRMPMDRIDLAVRRAGFDRDPGWVPWLRKRVRFVFEEDGERP